MDHGTSRHGRTLRHAFGNLGIFAEESGSTQEQARSLPSAWASGPTTRKSASTLQIMDSYGKRTWTADLFYRGDYRVPIE
ncbi:hypothetical protein F5B17DRAFT_116768 [Nemania serpens]|nr:hypothetical protein F5B17DRAFT_116768 [Nemania serpens]